MQILDTYTDTIYTGGVLPLILYGIILQQIKLNQTGQSYSSLEAFAI